MTQVFTVNAECDLVQQAHYNMVMLALGVGPGGRPLLRASRRKRATANSSLSCACVHGRVFVCESASMRVFVYVCGGKG